MRHPRATAAALAAILAGPVALAGPIWDEPTNNDAGDLPTNAQTPDFGAPFIERIRGSLTGEGSGDGGGDFQDMYKIFIAVPTLFFASTASTFGGVATFDTQLFLFDAAGVPVLANNDFFTPPIIDGSHLPGMADDGTSSSVMAPGIYYLAISGFPSVPVDAGGTSLFLFGTPSEVSGPDGSMEAIAGWSGPGAIGDYEIALSGVIPVPSPSSGLLVACGGLAALRRRR